MWVFGYGSLIWKVDFHYTERLVGYVKGYSRRFWQGSEDHRGVPGKPGRVVTLVKSKDLEERVYGAAYLVPPNEETTVLSDLDFREKCGYEKAEVMFYPLDGNVTPFQMMIYIGLESNPHFLGPASLDTIATHILSSEGPSGKNSEYLYRLAEAVRNIAPVDTDHHLFALETLVREKEKLAQQGHFPEDNPRNGGPLARGS